VRRRCVCGVGTALHASACPGGAYRNQGLHAAARVPAVTSCNLSTCNLSRVSRGDPVLGGWTGRTLAAGRARNRLGRGTQGASDNSGAATWGGSAEMPLARGSKITIAFQARRAIMARSRERNAPALVNQLISK